MPTWRRPVTGVTATLVVCLGAVALFAQGADVLSSLSNIALDTTQVFAIRDITIERDVYSISFNRGTIAFTQAVNGKVTGAVFLGSGDILAILSDRVERQQLHRFTKSAILSEHFETAILRFTDDTWAEILNARSARAAEDVDPEDRREILRWESELQRRARYLNDRIVADLLGAEAFPLFLAQIEGVQLGWFDAIYDERRSEEIVIEQGLAGSAEPIVWASFNKRSTGRSDAAALTTGETKSPFELMAYTAEGASALIRLRATMDGERVFRIPSAAPDEVVSAAMQDGQALPFVKSERSISVILPEPTRRGRDVSLRITYTLNAPVESGFPVNVADSVRPATYRDQWIVEGLAHYASAVSSDSLGLVRMRLLNPAPEGGIYASLGPVSVGYRLGQPGTTPGYATVLRDKSLWVIHMLRMLMRGGSNDESSFREMMSELGSAFDGGSISSMEFQRLAEKHAGTDLDWFFDQWVYGAPIPTYHLEYSVSPVDGNFVIQGKIEQSGVPASFKMPVPLYADDTLLGRVSVSGEEGDFRFVVRSRPERVLLDPLGDVLGAHK